MELKQELEIQTKVSQEMVQAVSVLQMTAWDLKQYVQEVMLENPVIELEERSKKQENDDTMRKLEWLENGDYQNKVYYQQELEESSEFWKENELDLREYLLEQLAFMYHGAFRGRCVKFSGVFADTIAKERMYFSCV